MDNEFTRALIVNEANVPHSLDEDLKNAGEVKIASASRALGIGEDSRGKFVSHTGSRARWEGELDREALHDALDSVTTKLAALPDPAAGPGDRDVITAD